MLIKVLTNYKSASNFDDPIILFKGDTVQCGEITDPKGEYPNWVFCKSNRTDKTGWVAFSVLRIKNNIGIVLQDYTSKEMTVECNEILDAEYELNGWYWCIKLADGERGWVAKNNTVILNEKKVNINNE